jgi:CHASE2 domain-containing sensor protein
MVDVLDGRVRARQFHDKLVVIGVVVPAGGDIHRTPLDDAMPGGEVQANAVDTMLQGEPLRDVSQLVDVLVIGLLACAPVAAALWRSAPVMAAVAAASAAALLVAAQLAFQGGWIVAVVVPLAALAAATLGNAAVGVVRLLLRPRSERVTTAD